MKSIVSRDIYFNKIKPFIGKELIKVLIGQRRSGKSYLLYQIIDEIRKADSTANILYINKELNEFEAMRTWQDLYAYIRSKSLSTSINHVFIDEIQDISGFENALKSLVAEGGFDIYISGSNSKLLSGELSTYLTGRYVEIMIYPLSFNEFLLFHQLENSDRSLNLYLKFGGMPYLKNLDFDDEPVFDYLKSVTHSILYKDIVSRFEIRNVDFLNRLVLFLAQHSGSIVSVSNVTKYLKSQQISISLPVVISYLNYLCTAFLIHKVQRADINGKKIFEIGEKYYFNDIGIRNCLIGYKPFDLGLIIENAVYNHLKVKGYNVLVGVEGDKEIDFIAEKKGEKAYFQVALRITEKATMEREFNNLLAIKDSYPKYVITMDEFTGGSFEGIVHLPLRQFLSEWDNK